MDLLTQIPNKNTKLIFGAVFRRSRVLLETLKKIPERPQQFFNLRQLVNRINLCKGDLPGFINNEHGALANTRDRRPFAQDAKLASHLGVRIKIRAKRNLDRPDFLPPPCDVARDRIYADVHDLGIKRRELFFSGIEFRHLRGSSRRPVQRMKRHDQVLPAEIVP